VRDLFGADVVDPLGFFHHRPVELDGIPMVLCRSGWSKQGGVELFLTNGSQGDRLWELIMAAGEPYGIGPGGPNQQERIETGLLSYQTDHDLDTDPIEAGLGEYVSLDGNHQFVGRTALEARLRQAIRRNVVNVRLDGSAADVIAVDRPLPASINGEHIGRLRTAVWSTKLDCWLGLAQLATPHDAAGTSFEITLTGGAMRSATVHHQPFGAIQT
jgi:aminomethyltransferase